MYVRYFVNAAHLSDLSKLELTFKLFGQYYLRTTTITNTEVSGNDLFAEYFHNTSFDKAKLENANFANSNLQFTFFIDANLSNADLSGADLRSSVLTNADLSGANLNGALLDGAVLDCKNHSICKNN